MAEIVEMLRDVYHLSSIVVIGSGCFYIYYHVFRQR